MGMLFTINEEGVISNSDWRGVKEFNALLEVEFRCVVMIWDNQSMYRRMPIEQREERVCKGLLGSNAERFLKSTKYKEASWLYRAIDFDIDLNMLEMYTKKLVGLSSMLNELEMSDDINVQKKYDTINKNVTNFMKLKNEFENKIEQRGKISKNFKVILSGIEKFYERAKMMKNEHEVYRNYRTQ
jgi:hypothetical protein